ncbi:MBL fold metallo-hydrolase [Verrucomicrobiota bacterium]
MKLDSILGNSPKLDGGAMFGNAPKALWESWIAPDELNRIQLACRSLLARTKNHTILFETGIGAFMEPKYRERYGVEQTEHVLLRNLEQEGISHNDITDIILSHLHFDHAGGMLSAWEEGKELELLFPNARYYVSEQAWERATHPHCKDRASFVPLLNQNIERSQRLTKLKSSDMLNFDELAVHFIQSDGHTPGMLCSDLRWNENRLILVADLAPGKAWIHLPITMGYDRFPELLVDEKQTLLSAVAKEGAWLFYTHDPHTAASKVKFDSKRKVFLAVNEQTDLREIFPGDRK